MHSTLIRLGLGLGFLTGTPTPGDILEGRSVFVVKPGVEMRSAPDDNASKVVGRVHDLTLRVLKVQGDSVAIRSSGVDGWIKKSDVVLYDKALAYFAGRIRDNPQDG